MPVVTIVQGERDLEEKRRLVTAITAVFVEVCGAERRQVEIIFHDVRADQWAAGGTLLADR